VANSISAARSATYGSENSENQSAAIIIESEAWREINGIKQHGIARNSSRKSASASMAKSISGES